MGGLAFLGPIHGVFPIGPNGIQAFDTLDPLPPNTFQTAQSYNYTVSLQGVSSMNFIANMTIQHRLSRARSPETI